MCRVRTEKGEVLSLPSSLEVKVHTAGASLFLTRPLVILQGIIGSDQRHYALDLFRIFPPDANFVPATTGDAGGKYRHNMAVLRPEFLDTFLR